MDISTLTPDKQVKLQYWLDVILQCRGSGLTNIMLSTVRDIGFTQEKFNICITPLALIR